MTELLFLRHAEPESAGLYIGRGSDPPLSPRGKAAADSIAAVLGTEGEVPEVIYSSPLRRARQTAEPLARRLKMPVTVHDGLSEIDFGEWEGLSWKAIEEREPDLWRAWLDNPREIRPPGGETLADLRRRVVEAVEGIMTKHSGRRVLISSHGGPIRAILGHALNLDASAYWSVGIDYGSLSRFARRGPGTLDLLQWNVPIRIPPTSPENDTAPLDD